MIVSIPTAGDALTESPETFTLLLSNAVGATIVDAIGTGTILDWTPVIAAGAAPAGEVGEHYSFLVPGSGAPPLSYSATGLAGTGLSIDAASGVISGIPAAVGDYPITVTLSNGPDSIASATYTIEIAPARALLPASGTTPAPWGLTAALAVLGCGLLAIARLRSRLQGD